MWRARAFENNPQPVSDRGADGSASRSQPLTLVSGAVAGDDLQSVVAAASEALDCAVAIAIPALGEPVVWPPGSLSIDQLGATIAQANSAIGGGPSMAPAGIAEAVVVRIGERVVGIVTAMGKPDSPGSPAERWPWLEAAAAAASVTALIRGTQDAAVGDSGRSLIDELSAGTPRDLPAWLRSARRLGFELAAGATAICAQAGPEHGLSARALARDHGLLLADRPSDRLLGLAPIGCDSLEEVTRLLRGHGLTVARSAPRRDPAALHQALQEAELLIELDLAPDVQLAGQDETYRLLIGVLLRDPEELAQLRARTISPLAEYDAGHDTDLLATLRAFLAYDGSTTETAEAMHLHRHTVGYRLSRVHEVSGLSPYESDGRERLSLGLKAHQILQAEERRGSAE